MNELKRAIENLEDNTAYSSLTALNLRVLKDIPSRSNEDDKASFITTYGIQRISKVLSRVCQSRTASPTPKGEIVKNISMMEPRFPSTVKCLKNDQKKASMRWSAKG